MIGIPPRAASRETHIEATGKRQVAPTGDTCRRGRSQRNWDSHMLLVWRENGAAQPLGKPGRRAPRHDPRLFQPRGGGEGVPERTDHSSARQREPGRPPRHRTSSPQSGGNPEVLPPANWKTKGGPSPREKAPRQAGEGTAGGRNAAGTHCRTGGPGKVPLQPEGPDTRDRTG